MSRSLIRSEQVVDAEFVSHAEHGNPAEVTHTFAMSTDTPATYSGSGGLFLRVKDDETGIEFSSTTSGSIDHGGLLGLSDDDHPQYLTRTDFSTYSGALQDEINNKDSSEQDIYTDILDGSKYEFLTYDDFRSETLVDTSNSTMTYDVNSSKYTFTAGQVLQSENLFDSVCTLTTVPDALIEMMYVASGIPNTEATIDGVNWEIIVPGEIHNFTTSGTTFKLRFTASGIGEINSWAVFYKQDESITTTVSNSKMVNFYYEATAQDEDIIIDGIYFSERVGISAITINARVAPTGSNLTVDILKDGSEQTKIATLTDTSVYEKTGYSVHSYFDTNERFGLKIKSVGSVEAGQGLNVTIFYYDR